MAVVSYVCALAVGTTLFLTTFSKNGTIDVVPTPIKPSCFYRFLSVLASVSKGM